MRVARHLSLLTNKYYKARAFNNIHCKVISLVRCAVL